MKFLALLATLLLTGCASKHMYGVDFNELTGSPCVDGVIYNIDQAGCEAFYWGNTDHGLKMRCTYAEHDNLLTVSSFYAVPLGVELSLIDGFIPWCADTQAIVYINIPRNELQTENSQ